MGKNHRNREVVAGAATPVLPGIIRKTGEAAFAYSTHNLPASDHFYMASHFLAKVQRGNLNILFGSTSTFSESNEFNTAIEINFPVQHAVYFLYDSVWNQVSANGKGVFIDSLREDVRVASELFGSDFLSTFDKERKSLKVPSGDKNRFRNFPSNFSTVTIASSQAMIEFFEASPEMTVSLILGHATRPNAGVKSIVSVILPPIVLLAFFEETKGLLEPYKKTLDAIIQRRSV